MVFADFYGTTLNHSQFQDTVMYEELGGHTYPQSVPIMWYELALTGLVFGQV